MCRSMGKTKVTMYLSVASNGINVIGNAIGIFVLRAGAVPNGIENGMFQLVKVALSSITALFGTIQIAANRVEQSFWSVAALMGTAMGLGFITVIGQCMGAGDWEAAQYYMRKLLRITLPLSIVWNGLIFFKHPYDFKRLCFVRRSKGAGYQACVDT